MVFNFNDIAHTVLPVSVILNVRCIGKFLILQVMYINNLITNETLIYETEKDALKDLKAVSGKWDKMLKQEEEKKTIGFEQVGDCVGFVQEQEEDELVEE